MTEPITKTQKRYLSRLVCAWCDQTLDKDECGAGWGKCSADERARLRATVLKEFKQRKGRA